MTSIQQRAALQRQIWQIANSVRGAVDGWDFKQYILGTLFYRFISENFENYINAGDDSINYADLPNSVITPEIKDDAIKTKGYFIYPDQLFVNVAKGANTNESLNTDLATIFKEIESSANGYPSEKAIKGLFTDFDTTSNRLGNTVKDKNARLAAVLKGVAKLDFGDFNDSHIDLFGDAYEFLISNYAANAGKSGGEFFTPQQVSKLIAKIAMYKQTSVNKIYDPACGSGSLLLQAKKQFGSYIVEDGFFGQEINHTTYNLARMNMFLHNINYNKFNIQLGNTLIAPHFGDEKPFDVIVSNPPYSVNWIGSDDPTLINDERFAPAGILAPKSKADFAFVLHALSYLSNKGRAAIVCFPGIFYRSGAEQKIRQYLVDNNYIEAVISLAPNLFYGTTIAVNILVLSKHKVDTSIQFIDASELFQKETNNNILTDKHIEKIIQAFDSKEDKEYFAKSVPLEVIKSNEYNLSVSSYVEVKDDREVVDITLLNAELKNSVTNIDSIRKEINKIGTEIEGDKLFSFEDSEVEWVPLDKAFDILAGGDVPKNALSDVETEEFNIPILSNGIGDKSLYGWTNKAKIEKPSLTISARGTIGWTSYRDKPFFPIVRLLVLTPKITLNLKYAYYFMKTIEGDYKLPPAGIPQLTKPMVKDILIPLPYPKDLDKSLAEQARIVAIMEQLETLTKLINDVLQHEIHLRQKQYKYYHDFLFSFPK